MAIKKLLPLFIFIFLLTSCNIFRDVSRHQINSWLVGFINITKPNRSVGLDGHKRAKDYIKNTLKGLASKDHINFYTHTFLPNIDFAVRSYQKDFITQIASHYKKEDPVYKKWDNFTRSSIKYVESYRGIKGENFVLEITGEKFPKQVKYVGAHYDTITHNHQTLSFTPNEPSDGADDNASGVAALFVLAEYFTNHRPDKTIRFIFLDFEEVFFLGSEAFARDLKNKKIPFIKNDETYLGYYNLEMIGHSTKKPAVLKIYTREDGQGRIEDYKLAHQMSEAAKKIDSDIQVKSMNNGFNRSDNWSFWQSNLASICITQDWEEDFNQKNYHTNHDNIEFLNIDYITEVTNIVLTALEKDFK